MPQITEWPLEFAANKEGALEMAPNPRAPHQPQCPKLALGPSLNARFAPEPDPRDSCRLIPRGHGAPSCLPGSRSSLE